MRNKSGPLVVGTDLLRIEIGDTVTTHPFGVQT